MKFILFMFIAIHIWTQTSIAFIFPFFTTSNKSSSSTATTARAPTSTGGNNTNITSNSSSTATNNNNTYTIPLNISQLGGAINGSNVTEYLQNISDLAVSFGIRSIRSVRSIHQPIDSIEVDDEDEHDLPPLEDELRRQSRRLSDEKSKQIENGIKKLAPEMQKISETSYRIQLNARSLGQQGIRQLEGLLNIFQTVAGDISDCFAENPFSFPTAINNAVNTAISCAVNRTREARQLVDDVQTKIENAYTAETNVTNDIDRCNVMFPAENPLVEIQRVNCLVSSLIRLRSENIKMPIMINQRVAEARSFFGAIQAETLQCALYISDEITRQAIETGQSIGKCVADRMTTTPEADETTTTTEMPM